MTHAKDDMLRAIMEIRQTRDAQAAAPQPEVIPSGHVQAQQSHPQDHSEQTPQAKTDSTLHEQGVAAIAQTAHVGPAVTDARAEGTQTPPLIAHVRLCANSFSGQHEWVYPRRGAARPASIAGTAATRRPIAKPTTHPYHSPAPRISLMSSSLPDGPRATATTSIRQAAPSSQRSAR